MSRLILIVVSCALVFGFKIQNNQLTQQFNSQYQSNNNFRTCSNDQINIVYNAISDCEVQDFTQTIICITHNILFGNGQFWDVFIKTQNSADYVVYWPNSCFIDLNNYGKFNRQYRLWSAFSNQINKQNLLNSKESLKSQTENKQYMLGCSQDQINFIQKAIKDCDVASNQNGSLCVVNSLKNNLNQKFNVYFSTEFNTGGSMAGYYYHLTACTFEDKKYGKYDRRIQIWQAE